MRKIFWRSKEGRFPPPDAQFSLWPFAGKPFVLNNYSTLSSLPNPLTSVQALSRIDIPDQSSWLKAVEMALKEIESGQMKKVVLARETIFQLDRAPDPFCIASLLDKRAQGASLFCVQLGHNRAFLGATPERLFQRVERKIIVEAIAGTRKRSINKEENLDLEAELLASEKDHREFQFVQDYFEEMLNPHCISRLEFSPIGLHRTANVLHLMSRASGNLYPNFSDCTIVEMLHPSPALCGTPKQKAFDWIYSHEPFSRGLYGGIIGWQTAHESDWMVAIRSCMLEGSTARIYTGTGIVAGSNPQAEWEELEAKLALYHEVFACGP